MSKIHFIGIKGVGMAALAVLAKEMGHEVSGSDIEDSFVTDEILAQAGITATAFSANNINNQIDLAVLSAAFGKDNEEVKEVKKKHLEIKLYSEALAYFSKEKQVIAVAGIHGKTTTAAMIAWILTKANFDPSYLVGAGMLKNLHNNAHFGSGEYFVVEADEYRKSPEDKTSKFLDLTPKIEVISSIEMDHPDMFLTEEDVYEVFYKFACRLPRNGFIVLGLDYPKARKLHRSLVDRKFETYGFADDAAWKIVEITENPAETKFFLETKNEKYGPYKILLPGNGNILNATACIIVTKKIGIEDALIKKYLEQFTGVKRRFEIIGKKGKVKVIDDYAHHPRSLKITLEAARLKYPKAKIWCIFQPHTYSRTKKLLAEFATSFNDADKVFITDIYASAREEDATINSQDLVDAIKEHRKSVKYVNNWDKILEEIVEGIEGETVIITIGAGDIYKLGLKIFEKLK